MALAWQWRGAPKETIEQRSCRLAATDGHVFRGYARFLRGFNPLIEIYLRCTSILLAASVPTPYVCFALPAFKVH